MLTRRAFTAGCAGALAHASALAQVPTMPGYALRFEWLEQGRSDASGNGMLDLGALRATGSGRSRRILLQRRVVVRIDGPGPAARLSVALVAETPDCNLRLDGLPLSGIARVIDPVHRVNIGVVHLLELEISPSARPGPFLSNIQWVAEPA